MPTLNHFQDYEGSISILDHSHHRENNVNSLCNISMLVMREEVIILKCQENFYLFQSVILILLKKKLSFIPLELLILIHVIIKPSSETCLRWNYVLNNFNPTQWETTDVQGVKLCALWAHFGWGYSEEHRLTAGTLSLREHLTGDSRNGVSLWTDAKLWSIAEECCRREKKGLMLGQSSNFKYKAASGSSPDAYYGPRSRPGSSSQSP